MQVNMKEHKQNERKNTEKKMKHTFKSAKFNADCYDVAEIIIIENARQPTRFI